MFDPQLRPLKDRMLEPLARRMPGVSPLALTTFGLAAGLGAALAGWHGRFGLGLALWVLNRMLDGLDGLVARMHGNASDLGGYLDLLADFVVYAAIPVALALRPGAPPELVGAGLVLVAAFYVNTASWMVPAALLEKRGQGVSARGEPTSVTIPEGLVSGGETVVFYGLFFLFPAQQVALFGLMAALTGVTVLQRLVWGVRVFRGPRAD
ncbi:MAG: CDP-alcohol phosphatidyltransferase family protein [Gemmatimonadota bacterium]